MPKVSIIILTKDRAGFLKRALESVRLQSFFDYEVVVVNDGSRDNTQQVLKDSRLKDLKILSHHTCNHKAHFDSSYGSPPLRGPGMVHSLIITITQLSDCRARSYNSPFFENFWHLSKFWLVFA